MRPDPAATTLPQRSKGLTAPWRSGGPTPRALESAVEATSSAWAQGQPGVSQETLAAVLARAYDLGYF
jgi:hypothetical protein